MDETDGCDTRRFLINNFWPHHTSKLKCFFYGDTLVHIFHIKVSCFCTKILIETSTGLTEKLKSLIKTKFSALEVMLLLRVTDVNGMDQSIEMNLSAAIIYE